MIGLIQHNMKQGSAEWHEIRRGVITGSRASDARDRSNGLEPRQQAYVDAILQGLPESDALRIAGYKKAPTSELVKRAVGGEVLPLVWGDKAIAYAKELARDRVGSGRAINLMEGFAQRMGHEEEPFAAIAWMAETGLEVEEVGFLTTEDRMFGCSPDRLVVGHPKRALEIKTMVSATTLFQCVVEGDIGDFEDQCLFEMWHMTLDQLDLCLWAPDLPKPLHIVPLMRDEAKLEAFEADMLAFRELVTTYENKLRAKLGMELVTTAGLIGGAPAAVPDETKPVLAPRPTAPKRVATPVPASEAAPFDFGALLPAELPF